MCRTAHAVLSTVICGIQMLVRVFMTLILMIENVIRMLLQTFYNFISFVLQMISLIPICVVFLLTARLKCFMCGGGGPCPVGARGGTCDCVMSFMAVIIIFLIFRATGVLDKVFYSLGYTKYEPPKSLMKFIPTPGELTECSRDSNETTTNATDSGPTMAMSDWIEKYSHLFTKNLLREAEELSSNTWDGWPNTGSTETTMDGDPTTESNWTTVVYYLV